ncbi:DNA-binding transcriptional ArsR family regulator [Aquimarina sp. EL_43]|uniref:ArsR/SmtB family transcription factor n=1 Tax=Aquimarina TaxID=290174 RepID=UPI000472E0F0|nr:MULTISPECIES: metalloregulator ArsR/SmtB family transcription factor [Aquimarina]MBG6129657.1 DNA-binding transcriptional ArsR family regulator [Aquimarina sp. EL_35]MBG6150722.1 DNA-binding transcriptional ArsR family regulator [Aquimarina sp. EL_32]MBG6167971.1 DNA-binding transcriptional ArsR family regulator [Aquimarina sp. EL_43]
MQDRITTILKAVADPTRREIFHALVVAATALPITQISSQFDISRQGITKHLKTLEGAGLINIDTKGRERFCQANANPLKEVNQWLKFYEQFWDGALDDLSKYLDNMS